MEELELINYEEKYFEEVVEFLKNIAINEFNFSDWESYFTSGKFLQLKSERDIFLLARKNNKIVGTIGLTTDYDFNTAKLHSLYVDKNERRNGIANKLYKKCEEFAREKNYTMIILHTYTEFIEAIKFYKKRGYKVNNDIESKDGMWFYKNLNSNENSEYVWKDYFLNLRNKYSMRVSSKEPLVINLDGKNITKGGMFSLVDNINSNSFLGIMEKTVSYFTKKYQCISIFGTDEVSFIFEKPFNLINDINDKSNKKSDEIISMFSQYFFDYFNSLNKTDKIFWHGECFSIPEGKINSYIKYKVGSIKNVLTTYFLKKNGVHDAGKIKLCDKIEECKKYEYYESNLKDIINGIMYYNGNRIDIDEFLKGNIVIIESKENDDNNENNNNQFIDLSSWN